MTPRLIAIDLTLAGSLGRRRLFPKCLLFCLLLSPMTVNAPDYRATLWGTVIDPAGSVVPASQVVVVNKDTGVRSLTETNGEGSYIDSFLMPGNYRLTAEDAGIKATDRTAIELRTNHRVRFGMRLDVGSLSEPS